MLLTSIQFPNLHISLNDLPKSFNLFGFDVAFYGVIMATAMLCGIFIVCREAKRTGQNPNDYLDFAIYAIIFSLIGARLYYVLFSWDKYKDNLIEIFNVRNGGMAIYGSVITAVIVCFVYSRIKKMSFRTLGDTGVFGLILGQIIGRWGNFFNREAFGGVTPDSNPLAMRIYFDDYYHSYQVPEAVANGMKEMTGKTIEQLGYIQVQPTFLYECLWNLCVLILMLVFRRKKKFEGEVVLWYLMGYGLGRSIIEGFRTDQLLMPFTGWPVSQVLSILLLIIAFTIWTVKRIKLRKAE